METEMKISKHIKVKTETEKSISSKKAEYEKDIAERQKNIASLSQLIKTKSKFVSRGTAKEKKATAMVCTITILLQALITAIIAACFGATNILAATVVYTVIYAAFMVFVLYLEYYTNLSFPVFQAIMSVVILVLLYTVTYCCFNFCDKIGINIIGANIIFTSVIVMVEILIGRHACKKALKSQRQEYNQNKKWLKDTEVRLVQQQNELQAKKQEFLSFDRESTTALSKMLQDIAALRAFLLTTKKKLQAMYAQNILHPNYQNWVAAATIYEYLDVGRCYELKGPDGAYNLYEKEVLAHKVLDSLAAINASIKQYGYSITESQRYIRNQLSECNRNVEQIVVNTYGFHKI